MSDLNLNLPDDLREFVDTQVQAGSYAGPAAYIEALIQRAKAGNSQLEELLLDGLNSGDTIPLDAQEWRQIRREVEQRLTNG